MTHIRLSHSLTDGLKRKLGDMKDEDCIQFTLTNPHKRDSAAYERYEKYKFAQTIRMFRLINKDSINRYRDWQYVINHKCAIKLNPVSLRITILNEDTLIDKTNWVCDNRSFEPDLFSMFENDFDNKNSIEK